MNSPLSPRMPSRRLSQPYPFDLFFFKTALARMCAQTSFNESLLNIPTLVYKEQEEFAHQGIQLLVYLYCDIPPHGSVQQRTCRKAHPTRISLAYYSGNF